MRLYRTIINQTGTAGAVDISEKAATTVTQIGKTETALKVISSAADAGLEHAVITAHYLDQDGVAHTGTIADCPADISGASVADFDTPVTDFYCWDIDTYGTDCFTSSLAVGGGKTLSAGVAGTGYAQIAAAGTSGTKTAYFGVGSIYGRLATDHADGDNFVGTLNFLTPWGKIRENYTCTLTATTTDEIIFLSSTGYPIQDFYIIRKLTATQLTTSNTGAFLLTDSNCGNVDGSSNDVWGGIAQGAWQANITKYMVPSDGVCYLAQLEANAATAALTLTPTLSPYGGFAIAPSFYVTINSPFKLEPIIRLKPLTTYSITVLGNTGTLSLIQTIIEVSDQNS